MDQDRTASLPPAPHASICPVRGSGTYLRPEDLAKQFRMKPPSRDAPARLAASDSGAGRRQVALAIQNSLDTVQPGPYLTGLVVLVVLKTYTDRLT